MIVHKFLVVPWVGREISQAPITVTHQTAMEFLQPQHQVFLHSIGLVQRVVLQKALVQFALETVMRTEIVKVHSDV